MTNTNKFKEVDELFDELDITFVTSLEQVKVLDFLHTQIEKALKEQAESILGEIKERIKQTRIHSTTCVRDVEINLYSGKIDGLSECKEIIKGYIKQNQH